VNRKPSVPPGQQQLGPLLGQQPLVLQQPALGRVTPELRDALLGICRRQIDDNGVDCVILGCTELPLVIAAGDLPVPVVDTTRCHAEAIVARTRR
jgi:aspartate racemase